MFEIISWSLTRKNVNLMELDILNRFYTFFAYNRNNLWNDLFSFLHIKFILKKSLF